MFPPCWVTGISASAPLDWRHLRENVSFLNDSLSRRSSIHLSLEEETEHLADLHVESGHVRSIRMVVVFLCKRRHVVRVRSPQPWHGGVET